MSFRRPLTGGLPHGLGTTVLAFWLIVTGALPFVHIGGQGLLTILSIAAIVAGVLLLLNR